jgi:hypothetical protein
VKRAILSEYGFPNDMPQLVGRPIFEERHRIAKVAQREGIEHVALIIGGFFDNLYTILGLGC